MQLMHIDDTLSVYKTTVLSVLYLPESRLGLRRVNHLYSTGDVLPALDARTWTGMVDSITLEAPVLGPLLESKNDVSNAVLGKTIRSLIYQIDNFQTVLSYLPIQVSHDVSQKSYR